MYRYYYYIFCIRLNVIRFKLRHCSRGRDGLQLRRNSAPEMLKLNSQRT